MGYPWFLIIVIIAFIALSLWVGLYIILNFQHPEDKHSGWFPKIIGVLAFTFSTMNVLMLSLDSINRSSNNGLNMEIMCLIFTIGSVVVGFILIPFTIFYFERKIDEDTKHPISCAIGATIAFFLLLVIVFIIFYFAVAYCEVSIEVQTTQLTSSYPVLECPECKMSKATWQISPSFLSFLLCTIGFFGYLFLILFGGPGFVTLPINFLMTFINRPRAIDAKTYVRATQALNGWATELEHEGQILRESVLAKGRNHKTVAPKLILFDKNVEALEETYKTVEIMYRVKGGNPIWPWCCLILGILSIIISLLWIIHIIIFYLADVYPFLNKFFTILDDAFPYAAVLFFGLFTFYLYLCVLSGVTTIGVNFLCFRLHPMVREGTPLTSILFNADIILIASFGVALFSTMNFPIYTRLTALDMLYGVQVQTMKGLKYVWEYGVYVMFATLLIALVWRLCTCKKKDRRLQILNECFSNRSDVQHINP